MIAEKTAQDLETKSPVLVSPTRSQSALFHVIDETEESDSNTGSSVTALDIYDTGGSPTEPRASSGIQQFADTDASLKKLEKIPISEPEAEQTV